jgi:hypothetical protein
MKNLSIHRLIFRQGRGRFMESVLTGMRPFAWLEATHCDHASIVCGNLEDDWHRVGCDIYAASEKLRSDRERQRY